MAPIPIYSKSPISAAKADGVTPKTESGADSNSRAGRYAPETPTKTSPLSARAGGPPPPQPGAVPSLPQPTGAGQSPSYRGQYAPPPPATTSAVGSSSRPSTNYTPPPPQPGAVPVPPSTAGANNYVRAGTSPGPPTTTAAAVLPPPPRAGESLASTGILSAQTQTQTQTQQAQQPTSTMSLPPQMGIAPLTASPYPSAARGTSTATTQGAAYGGMPQPTGLAQGLAMGEQQERQQINLNHPPGYVQDPYAAEMTGSQRATAAQVGTSGGGNGGLSSYHSNSAFNSSNRSTFDDGNGEGLWDAAKKFAVSAGERLSAAETEVWRRINNQS
ncbi:hypothetical protein HMPREF1624_06555 [Sporothrix schenckii ATCC 58251]|uniref:Uncharacterized protein n=1 Tax=Sporothrix schenckii (strain ATCC 58251 / de Perez 2211183) TaxID=1391915 RepID=U7PR43_SPOS1|nr:hypothetical protein HMPREF1624_06555 [Sporothrix schenckii ATCC 58251]